MTAAMSESLKDNLPSVDEVAVQLWRCRMIARRYNVMELDVRLCVEDDGSWVIRSGDVQYDTHHSAHCGASIVNADESRESVEETAADLLSQVEDSIADSED